MKKCFLWGVCPFLVAFSACGITGTLSQTDLKDESPSGQIKVPKTNTLNVHSAIFSERIKGSGWVEVIRYLIDKDGCIENTRFGEGMVGLSLAIYKFTPQKVVEALPAGSLGRNAEGIYLDTDNSQAISWLNRDEEILGADTLRMEVTRKWTLKEWNESMDTLVVYEESRFIDRYKELHVGRYLVTYRRLTVEEEEEFFR